MEVKAKVGEVTFNASGVEEMALSTEEGDVIVAGDVVSFSPRLVSATSDRCNLNHLADKVDDTEIIDTEFRVTGFGRYCDIEHGVRGVFVEGTQTGQRAEVCPLLLEKKWSGGQ